MLFGGKKNQNDSAARRRMLVQEAAEPTPGKTKATFRRNRTITDRSTIPEVSERVQAHHLRALRKKVGAILLATLGMAALTVVGISQFTASVRVVAANSTTIAQPFDAKIYQGYIDEYFGRYPLERLRFLTNYDQLSRWMQESAPEIATVVPWGIESLGVTRYEVRLRQPLVSWQVNDEQYYVDTAGVTFKKNYYTEPAVRVFDQSGARVQQGAAIASSRLLSFVGRAVALASDSGVAVTRVEIPPGLMRSVYLHGDGIPVIRMAMDRGVEYQIIDMNRTLSHFKGRGELPAYIDVRTPGKVFYR